jgi:hypothetical protein
MAGARETAEHEGHEVTEKVTENDGSIEISVTFHFAFVTFVFAVQ